MKKIQISPSILAGDFSNLGSEIKRLEQGGADMIHVDVMDGHFVPNLTIGPPVIKSLRKYTNLPFDVHLMISPVHKYIKNFSDAGSDIITIHPEATEDVKDSIDLIKSLGKKVGLSLNPDTPIEIIENYFEEMNKLNNDLGFTELSMGMSSDYLAAVKYSSTYVRVGSSIFGQRS